MQMGLLVFVCLMGITGVVAAIRWPIRHRRDPFAEPFGDVPRLPAGSLDRGDWL